MQVSDVSEALNKPAFIDAIHDYVFKVESEQNDENMLK